MKNIDIIKVSNYHQETNNSRKDTVNSTNNNSKLRSRRTSNKEKENYLREEDDNYSNNSGSDEAEEMMERRNRSNDRDTNNVTNSATIWHHPKYKDSKHRRVSELRGDYYEEPKSEGANRIPRKREKLVLDPSIREHSGYRRISENRKKSPVRGARSSGEKLRRMQKPETGTFSPIRSRPGYSPKGQMSDFEVPGKAARLVNMRRYERKPKTEAKPQMRKKRRVE